MIFKDYKNIAIEKYNFLVKEYNFNLSECREESYGVFLTYSKKSIMVELGYEYKEQRFFNYLNDGKHRIIFHDYFKKKDPNFQWHYLMPLDDNFSTAIDRNIELLRKHAMPFLHMQESL